MRPIDADAFKREISAYAIANNIAPNKALVLCKIIDKQPTIDAEPVRHGKLYQLECVLCIAKLVDVWCAKV